MPSKHSRESRESGDVWAEHIRGGSRIVRSHSRDRRRSNWLDTGNANLSPGATPQGDLGRSCKHKPVSRGPRTSSNYVAVTFLVSGPLYSTDESSQGGLRVMAFCTNCGTPLNEGSTCSKCGNSQTAPPQLTQPRLTIDREQIAVASQIATGAAASMQYQTAIQRQCPQCTHHMIVVFRRARSPWILFESGAGERDQRSRSLTRVKRNSTSHLEIASRFPRKLSELEQYSAGPTGILAKFESCPQLANANSRMISDWVIVQPSVCGAVPPSGR